MRRAAQEPVVVNRDVRAVIVPAGVEVKLRPGTVGTITQALGGSYTIYVEGNLFRIAGVDVGRVSGVDKGPGNLAAVTLDIQDRGLPLHRDATLRIRPRLFLEGGYYVDLSPGTPSAPELSSGATLGPAQTTSPVQLDQLLSTFDAPIRSSLKETLKASAEGFSRGGAKGLREVAPQHPLLVDIEEKSALFDKAAEKYAPKVPASA